MKNSFCVEECFPEQVDYPQAFRGKEWGPKVGAFYAGTRKSTQLGLTSREVARGGDVRGEKGCDLGLAGKKTRSLGGDRDFATSEASPVANARKGWGLVVRLGGRGIRKKKTRVSEARAGD